MIQGLLPGFCPCGASLPDARRDSSGGSSRMSNLGFNCDCRVVGRAGLR